MTDGEYIAAEMIGVVLATALVMCSVRRRKMEGATVAGGFVAGAFLGGVVLTWLGHLCHAGDPYHQAAVLGSVSPSSCLSCARGELHGRRAS